MRVQIMMVLLLLAFIGEISAETYQLGTHKVSLNLSVPANYSEDLPFLGDMRSYILNITPSTGGFALISVEEASIPTHSSKPTRTFADSAIEGARAAEIGDLKYGMITYRGHDAFEMSYPAQRVRYDGQDPITILEYHCLAYQLDELTGVMIQTKGANETIFEDLKNSTQVTKI